MARSRHSASAALILALAVISGLGPTSAFATDLASRSMVVGARPITGAWTGGVSIWRSSAFASQATTTWCIAGATQTMLNLVLGRSRSDRTQQAAIMSYAKSHDSLVRSAGSDPQGWAASLRYFGNSRTATYHWARYGTYTNALRAAAYKLRMTGKPVGLLVYGGKHANVMVGFTATADPALGSGYTVTSVQVAGPWYPRPTLDPPPGTWLSTTRLASRFTRYWERDGLAAWVGRWVTIEP